MHPWRRCIVAALPLPRCPHLARTSRVWSAAQSGAPTSSCRALATGGTPPPALPAIAIDCSWRSPGLAVRQVTTSLVAVVRHSHILLRVWLMAWNVQMGDELAECWSQELSCIEHGIIQCDKAYSPLPFAHEPTVEDQGRVLHGDTENKTLRILEDDESPARFPTGNGALMEFSVGKGPGGGGKPQVRKTHIKIRVYTHLDNTAHTAHARVVPTCQRPMRAF